jgi:hypothetical protein
MAVAGRMLPLLPQRAGMRELMHLPEQDLSSAARLCLRRVSAIR